MGRPQQQRRLCTLVGLTAGTVDLFLDRQDGREVENHDTRLAVGEPGLLKLQRET